jgi:hypothetical protein
MTFGNELQELDHYRAIPFLVEDGCRFEDLLPGLPNPSHSLRTEQKALYHALCVMAGNFPQLLWQAAGRRLGEQLRLPQAVLEPYLRQTLENHLRDPEGALTGPLARGDEGTMARNLAALGDDPLADLYRAFQDFHGTDGRPVREGASLAAGREGCA